MRQCQCSYVVVGTEVGTVYCTSRSYDTVVGRVAWREWPGGRRWRLYKATPYILRQSM